MGVGETLGHGGAVLLAVEGGVHGVGGAFEAGTAEVVDEQVAGQRRNPGLEAAFEGVEAGEVLVELEEDVLGQVLGVTGRAGEAVADGIDAAMLRDDKLLPGLRVAGDALGKQLADGLLLGLLFRRALQLDLEGIGWWEKCTALGGDRGDLLRKSMNGAATCVSTRV